jgi:hypothetical protein
MVIGILQPGFMPWLGFFEQVYQSDIFVLYDDVQFEKGSWRNRNRIKTGTGPLWLTVPVLTKGRHFPLIKDVLINPDIPWQKNHIRTITQYYSKAPFFEQYAAGVFSILDKPREYLLDLDLELTYWLVEQLGITSRFVLSSDLKVPGSNVQRLIDIIHAVGGDTFYEGSAGRNYIDTRLFQEAGIKVVFQEYSHPVYPQLYGDFISHLSVIDLLFNCGPDSRATLLNTSCKEET